MTERAAGRRQAGFTLLEMVVVLAILALVAGLVLQRGPNARPALQAQVAATDIVRLLRGARARAIAGGRPAIVVVDAAAGAVQAGSTSPYLVPPTVQLATLATTGGGRVPTILFWPDGSASGGVIEVAGGQRRLAVVVDWFTGRVQAADAP
jgi:general secretion pathway protein H